MIRAGTALALLAATPALAGDTAPFAPHAGNPLLPGYFADPSIVHEGGEWFVYATIDPWGGERLGLWRSRDFRRWTFSTPNWPTKAAATSPTSKKSRVWAPSVVKAHGRFWMYVSVGSEVWVGVADHPAGPWVDANGGRPLIPANYRPGYHMIDAEAFVDDDGQAYLYWGSGLNWVDGHCFVVKLKPDMVTFDGEPRDVTPAHYFEAPFMAKRDGRYFLTYSWGNTTKDTYQVRYAIGPSPLGPFVEPEDAPILSTDATRGVVSPGHHALFRAGGEDFILYHRQALPFVEGGDVLRQVAVDRIRFVGARIARVEPTNAGVAIPGGAARRAPTRAVTLPAAAGDDNYATAWHGAAGATLTADLMRVTRIGASELRPAYPDRALRVAVEASRDGQTWRSVEPERVVRGSPIAIPAAAHARYIRLVFPDGADILEWSFPR